MKLLTALVVIMVTGCASTPPLMSYAQLVNEITPYSAQDESAAVELMKQECAQSNLDYDRYLDSVKQVNAALQRQLDEGSDNSSGFYAALERATPDAEAYGQSRPRCQSSASTLNRILVSRSHAAKAALEILEKRSDYVPGSLRCTSNQFGNTIYTNCN